MNESFDVKRELRFLGGVLDMRQFDKVFICLSGGKDSHAMLFLIKELSDIQGSSDNLLAIYADTGMEWHNTEAHVRALCTKAQVPLEVVRPVRPLMDQMEYRGQRLRELGRKRRDGKENSVLFPSPKCRYCTRNSKMDPMDKAMRQYSGLLLKVTGERREESKARSLYEEYVKVDRLWTEKAIKGGFRHVYGWRPMLSFKTNDIFRMVKDTGVARHMAYDAGCDRLGCAGCIFSSDKELRIEMENNPLIRSRLSELEERSGFTMSMDGATIEERLRRA